MKNSIRAILIDDEYSNRTLLKDLILTYTEKIQIPRHFSNLKEAISYLENYPVDVVFLDIEMPEHNGLELFKLCSKRNFKVVVVSAYDRYAIPAIKEGIFDYLLKPVEINELKKSLYKLEEHFKNQLPKEQINLLVDGNTRLVKFDQILFIEAAGSYSKFVLEDGSFILQSYNLSHFNKILKKPLFVRVHRSYIVNSSKVISVGTADNSLTLVGGLTIHYSSRRKNDVKKYILT